jgi:ABC-2 type transport system ATP-binding protein
VSAAPTLASAAPEIDFAQLVKRYGRKPALEGVDLQLTGAQLVGVVGPDGAGKTTLLRAIAGLLEVEAQRANVLGYDLRGGVRALKAQVGYVPQVFALNRELSVIENLRFTGKLPHRDTDFGARGGTAGAHGARAVRRSPAGAPRAA